jgi:hypothetical protein
MGHKMNKIMQKFNNFIIFWVWGGGGAQFSSLPQAQKTLVTALATRIIAQSRSLLCYNKQ